MSVMRAGTRVAVALCMSATLAYAQDGKAQNGSRELTAKDAKGEKKSVSAAYADEMLHRYFEAMAKARLLAAETGTAAQMRALVGQGEQLYLEGRYADALVLLLEAVESPRFADFRDLTEALAAEHMLGAAHVKLGSLRTALGVLTRSIDRGPESPYFVPSVRLYVEAALELSDPDAAADGLEPRVMGGARGSSRAGQPQDVQSELFYLRARARFGAGELDAAAPYFRRVTPQSRFYGSAQYMLGAIATRARKLREAEARFCRVAKAGTGSKYAFYVDGRFFEVQDLARLGLGRVAHESRRSDDAFYYYFQVPQDSPRLPDALFESAYSSYEGEEPDTAIDLLDQLQARFPEAALSDEAAMLRGYVALARCDFDKANAQFRRFVAHYDDVRAEAVRLLQSRTRRETLHEELIAARSGGKPERAIRRELVTLLQIDPELHRIYDELYRLETEAARSGRVAVELGVLEARFSGSDRPRAAAALTEGESEVATLSDELKAATENARALGEQLDELRTAGVKERELAPLEAIASEQSRRLDALYAQAGELRRSTLKRNEPGDAPDASTLAQLIAHDVARTARLPARVDQTRAALRDRADRLARAALDQLATRLAGWLGQARIGRIDAVMGSKRRAERQIESLAAGRLPPELNDPLRSRGLLDDDEEYWPFEGEDWPDEHEEHYQ